jgi:hypothetical protein
MPHHHRLNFLNIENLFCAVAAERSTSQNSPALWEPGHSLTSTKTHTHVDATGGEEEEAEAAGTDGTGGTRLVDAEASNEFHRPKTIMEQSMCMFVSLSVSAFVNDE